MAVQIEVQNEVVEVTPQEKQVAVEVKDVTVVMNQEGVGATGISENLSFALKTYFTNMQTLLSQLAYTTESHIGNTLVQNAKDIVAAIESGMVEPEQPESGIVQTGSVLAITSGVTATQTGTVLVIA